MRPCVRVSCVAITAAISGTSLGRVARADFIGFGDFSGWTLNQSDAAAAPTPVAGGIKLTHLNDVVQQARSIWHNTPQDIDQFSATFTYQALDAATANGFGVAFVIQSSPSGLGATASTGSSGGYSGIPDSVAVTLELSPSRSGVYTNGIFGGGSAATGVVDLRSGHAMSVEIAYNGSLLNTTITDTVTLSSYSTSALVNIPGLVGGSTAWVGFTASTGFGSSAGQYILNPQFSTVPVPGVATILGVVGFGLGQRRRR